MTPQEILLRAADILEATPNAWTQGAMARNPEGFKVNPKHPTAVCFCGLGAIQRAVIDNPKAPWVEAEALLAGSLSNNEATMFTIVRWNDAPERTREEVIAQMRKAAL
jgi:hypothetical protein